VDEKLDNFSKIIQAKEVIVIAPKLLRIINNLGYRVIRVLMIEGSSKTLQFMIERADLSNITIKECSKLSSVISEILEERELIQDQYNLEVSSPGLERPIIEYSDFKRFIGSEVKIKLKDQYKKKIKFNGVIKECVCNKITFIDNKDDEIIIIPITSIDNANLIFTDF